MAMEDDNVEVVIIGAGISGLATALALHKKGIRSIVMEKSKTLRNITGSAIGIRQNGWRALDQLGVADILRRTAVPIHRECMVYLDARRRQEFSMGGESRFLRRKDLIDTLYDALPPATVKFGWQLQSIKLDSHTNKPILQFTHRRSIITKVVIGCDGGKSVVSDFLNLKPANMFPLCDVRGLTDYPTGHSFHHEFVHFKKDNINVGRVPIDDNLVYWFCTQPIVSIDERNWEDPDVIRQSTLELLCDYPKEILEMVKSANVKSLSFTRLRYHAPWDLLMGTFSKGTVTVAGDAMHVMGPFLGQAGSAGLEDAVVLARNMAITGLNHVENGRKFKVRQGVENALNMYVDERRMRLVWLSLQTYLISMVVLQVGVVSRLKKFVCSMLLVLLYRNRNSHIDYDCGRL